MDEDVLVFLQVMLSLVLAGGAGYTMFILVHALGRKLARRPGGEVPEGILEELEQLRAQASEVEELRARLTEVEERLDFAERLLTQPAEASRLAAPDSRS